ncbi:MAG: sigma-70 family RNA polymerase sigma factor, partial [Planctomycetota bacterium]
SESHPGRNGENPLLSGCPADFDRLIEAVGPASMLVLIRSRMGALLLERLEPEDIWQEALIHAWRDRESLEWQGLKAFRRWLLQIIENRIRDAADHEEAAKRGSGESLLSLDAGSTWSGASASTPPLPLASTTPSRIAVHREQARAMQQALEALDEEERDIVRLRLFEDLTIDEVAGATGLTPATAKYRLRKAVELYHSRLVALLGSRSSET